MSHAKKVQIRKKKEEASTTRHMDEKTTYVDMVFFSFFGEREVINVASLTLYLWQIAQHKYYMQYDKYIKILI